VEKVAIKTVDKFLLLIMGKKIELNSLFSSSAAMVSYPILKINKYIK